ncbi:MAG: ATP-binding cassette domain-containing protein [Actinobacteria bacterium]|nr:ATP-binding cassette domain-containing protein [Actinomycetota bacterium]
MQTPFKSSSAASVVEVRNLTKKYGQVTAVDDLSFDVPSGQVVGLLGPNGAGKTTAMKMLMGLVTPTSGSASLLGADTASAKFAHTVRRAGSLIETPALYERLSARQNLDLQALALGTTAGNGRIDELLDLVDLVDRANDKAGTFSLGMKQRLGIAIAMVGNPEIVILDEPANGLDPAGIVEIRKLLRRLPDMGTTVLVSSHQLAEVQQACDRLVIMANGRLVVEGTTTEILASYQTTDVEVRLHPDDLAAATDRLIHLSLSSALGSGPSELVVSLPDTWTPRDLNRVLADAGVYAEHLALRRVSLEAAFLEMTAPPAPTEVSA